MKVLGGVLLVALVLLLDWALQREGERLTYRQFDRMTEQDCAPFLNEIRMRG